MLSHDESILRAELPDLGPEFRELLAGSAEPEPEVLTALEHALGRLLQAEEDPVSRFQSALGDATG
jgi:hypothetical protein